MEESWDIYDADRKKTGETHLRGQKLLDGQFHLAVEIWTINSSGKILLTRRHSCKPFPGQWECTAGSAISGEDSREAAQRELEEEVGITIVDAELELVDAYRATDSFCDVWLARKDVRISELRLQPGEVSAAKWVTIEEFRGMYEQKRIVPRLSYLYRLIDSGKIPIAGCT
ncbi:MAG: NUDIX domain-containing protein [Candidatus Hydrogenedentes bacterium]|nr:NUDIX domain-containing protein [Candidatus Hydrogenedentota bacterium]